jgi:UDP-N-acetylmuramoylalanine--D-glutamate ligase
MKPIIIVGLGATGYSCVEYFYNLGIPIKVMDTRDNPPNLIKFNKLFNDIPVHLGSLYEPWLLQADKIVVSPGVSLSSLAIQKVIAKGITITNDIQIFIDALQQRAVKPQIVAITGSNGKSTVVRMIESIANSAGLNPAICGNIGIPVLSLLNKTNINLFILELSSFQLDITNYLPVDVATVLNITPDHLDRHKDLTTYTAVKNKIYLHAANVVHNAEDSATLPQTTNKDANIVSFSSTAPQNNQFGINTSNNQQYLASVNNNYLSTNKLMVKGKHNQINALAAIALSKAIYINDAAITTGLKIFKGLEHRCQWVGCYNNVNWFNDSKATNIGSTAACLACIETNTVKGITLLAGGDGKGVDFSPLSDIIKLRVKNLIVYGKDAHKIANTFADYCSVHQSNSLQHAVITAHKITKKFEAVVLSPACSSLDMFDSFAHRGEVFMQLVDNVCSDNYTPVYTPST